MLRFDSDYMEGAHPAILARLDENNLCKMTGYGEDPCTKSAQKKILDACGIRDGSVVFLNFHLGQ